MGNVAILMEPSPKVGSLTFPPETKSAMALQAEDQDTERRIRLRLADVQAFLTQEHCTDANRREIDDLLTPIAAVVDRAKEAPEEAR